MTHFLVEEDWGVRFQMVRFFKDRNAKYRSEVTRWRHFDVFSVNVPDELAVEFKLAFSEHILPHDDDPVRTA